MSRELTMLSRLKAFGLLGAVVLAALVPLYGDPRSSPVTHAEWARMVLRALGMEDVLQASAQASQAFSALSWKNSLAYRADRYLRADGVEVVDHHVTASERSGDVVYPLAVVHGGDYKLRLRLAGSPASPVEAQVTPVGAVTPVKTFTFTPASIGGWIDAGAVHLDPGGYTTSVLLPAGTTLEEVEVAPPCVPAVEPPGGWKATAITQTTDLAVTVVKAIDKESELPSQGSPVEVTGADFQTLTGVAVAAAAVREGAGSEGFWLKAGPAGLEAMVFVDIPEAGLYTVSSYGIQGGGQSWLGDSCRKAVLCGGAEALAKEAGPEWKRIMTAEFTAGRHFFKVILGSGAGIERVRFERKKDSPADYVETAKRLGFDPGPEGPVARNKAVDAMKFIEGQRTQVIARPCGDPLTTTVVASAGQTGRPGQAGPLAQAPPPVAGPGAAPPNVGAGPPPLAPPAVPPQQPASPVTP